MHSVSTVTTVPARMVTIETDVYGACLNRKVTAVTEHGLFVGTISESDTGFRKLGTHTNVEVELHRFYSGRVLVGRILDSSNSGRVLVGRILTHGGK